ncbi:MAG: VOC family protein [Pseudonocardiaceae bacterium]
MRTRQRSRGARGYEYGLAGCSPLAGDIFGRYRFSRPLQIGQPPFFHLLGAYAFARAAPFIGVLWPSLYRITSSGEIFAVQQPEFSRYPDFWRTNAMCLKTDDVDVEVTRLRTSGTPVLYEPTDHPYGERMAYVADPDGRPILLYSKMDIDVPA